MLRPAAQVITHVTTPYLKMLGWVNALEDGVFGRDVVMREGCAVREA